MFLFARLVINNLANQPTKARFLEETVDGRFPEDLDSA